MNELEIMIIKTLVDLYEHQTGEKYECKVMDPDEPEVHKEKSA